MWIHVCTRYIGTVKVASQSHQDEQGAASNSVVAVHRRAQQFKTYIKVFQQSKLKLCSLFIVTFILNSLCSYSLLVSFLRHIAKEFINITVGLVLIGQQAFNKKISSLLKREAQRHIIQLICPTPFTCQMK